jgi:hypothetical protein
MNIFLGFLIIAAGFLLMSKSEWLLNNFGGIPFFERYFGSSGGSRFGYKVIGIVTIFIGILVTIGMLGAFVGWALSPLLKHSVMNMQ